MADAPSPEPKKGRIASVIYIQATNIELHILVLIILSLQVHVYKLEGEAEALWWQYYVIFS